MDCQNHANFLILIMKNTNYILAILFFVMQNAMAQFSPQTKKVTEKFFPENDKIEEITPALQKKKGYTNYEELIAFLDGLVAQHPDKIKLSYIGESQKGKQIPMVFLSNSNANPKLKVWIQGGLHGDEPASTEGILYFLFRVLNDKDYQHLLNNLDIAVVPMANIDGYLKDDRYAANGLDLNRDQTKLMAPETVLLKKAFVNFNPEVGLDFHEYRPYRKDFAELSTFGITSAYDAMFLHSGNLNVPKNLRKITDTLFVQNAKNEMLKNGLRPRNYITSQKFGGKIQFNQGSNSARSSATNYALNNMISTLFEVRGVGIGRTSFKRRIGTTFLLTVSYLETAAANISLVKNEIKKANEASNEAFVTTKREIYNDTIQAIDLDSNELIDLEITIHDAMQTKPALTRKRPEAYIIDKNQITIIEKLKALGIAVEEFAEETQLVVESYTVSSYNREAEKYEKMNLQTVETTLKEDLNVFPKGTFKIPMNQKRANLVIELLESEAPNSFVSFGVLETDLNQQLPIYRLLNKQ